MFRSFVRKFHSSSQKKLINPNNIGDYSINDNFLLKILGTGWIVSTGINWYSLSQKKDIDNAGVIISSLFGLFLSSWWPMLIPHTIFMTAYTKSKNKKIIGEYMIIAFIKIR